MSPDWESQQLEWKGYWCSQSTGTNIPELETQQEVWTQVNRGMRCLVVSCHQTHGNWGPRSLKYTLKLPLLHWKSWPIRGFILTTDSHKTAQDLRYHASVVCQRTVGLEEDSGFPVRGNLSYQLDTLYEFILTQMLCSAAIYNTLPL